MERKGKRRSAIAGAIMAYIKFEEEAKAKKLARPRVGLAHPHPWRMSACQDTMQLRKLYQLRLTKK